MEISTPTKPPQRSKRECWQEHIKAWEASDLTQKDFCKHQQLSYPQFGYWRKRLHQQKEASKDKKLLPVKVANKAGTSSLTCIRLRLPTGVMVEIPCALSADKLKLLFHCLGITQ